jgi:hypothetical protein
MDERRDLVDREEGQLPSALLTTYLKRLIRSLASEDETAGEWVETLKVSRLVANVNVADQPFTINARFNHKAQIVDVRVTSDL